MDIFFIWIALFNLIIGISIILLGWTLLSAHHELEINKNKNYYRYGLNILGIRFGKKKNFPGIEHCLITKTLFTERYVIILFPFIKKGYLFNGYLKLKNGESLFIGSKKSRSDIIKKFNFFRFNYNVEIIDPETSTR